MCKYSFFRKQLARQNAYFRFRYRLAIREVHCGTEYTSVKEYSSAKGVSHFSFKPINALTANFLITAESGEFDEPTSFEAENQNEEKEDTEEVVEDAKDSERKIKRENSGTEAGEMADDDDDNTSSNKDPVVDTAALHQNSIQKMPRPLHKTHSIFLRNLHPSITRQVIFDRFCLILLIMNMLLFFP